MIVVRIVIISGGQKLTEKSDYLPAATSIYSESLSDTKSLVTIQVYLIIFN